MKTIGWTPNRTEAIVQMTHDEHDALLRLQLSIAGDERDFNRDMLLSVDLSAPIYATAAGRFRLRGLESILIELKEIFHKGA